jgi:hypothetical protein
LTSCLAQDNYLKNENIMESIKQDVNKMNLDEKLAQLGSHLMYELQTSGKLDRKKVSHNQAWYWTDRPHDSRLHT